MHKTLLKPRSAAGSTLITVLLIGGFTGVVLAATLSLSSSTHRNAHGRADWNSAFYHAENALQWAAQNAFDVQPAVGSSSYYSTASGTLNLSYMTAEIANQSSGFKNASVSIANVNSNQPNVFLVTASARVNDKVRTVQAQVTIRPVSQVFDYEYFLNNWGWWWGSTITGNGAQRANWDFDFQGNPQVNGSIFAANYVEGDEIPITNGIPPFAGSAGADPKDLVHSGAPRVTMPNLLDFSVYNTQAMTDTSTNGIWVGTNQVVFGIQTNSTHPGVYVVGTAAQPVTIKGTVVVPGDVVIQGKVTGKGTLYVGGNLYIAGDVTYLYGPNFSTSPETMTPTNRDAWVSASATNDLIAYAVKGSILAGDVTDPDWINWCYNYPGSGMAHVGDEAHLGQDGIEGTPDDNIPFLHPDGTMSTWYDADGDGIMEGNYDYNSYINMNTVRASKILGYPTNDVSSPVPYNTVASDNMGNLDGIFYTDHAAAMRLANTTVTFHGAIVSRNEQIIFQSYLNLNYDSRVHSRYRNNPNQYVNLGLPYGKAIQIDSFAELTPDPTNL